MWINRKKPDRKMIIDRNHQGNLMVSVRDKKDQWIDFELTEEEEKKLKGELNSN